MIAVPSSPWDAEGSLVFPSTDTSLHRQGQDRTAASVPGDAPAEAAEDGASNTPTGLPTLLYHTYKTSGTRADLLRFEATATIF